MLGGGARRATSSPPRAAVSLPATPPLSTGERRGMAGRFPLPDWWKPPSPAVGGPSRLGKHGALLGIPEHPSAAAGCGRPTCGRDDEVDVANTRRSLAIVCWCRLPVTHRGGEMAPIHLSQAPRRRARRRHRRCSVHLPSLSVLPAAGCLAVVPARILTQPDRGRPDPLGFSGHRVLCNEDADTAHRGCCGRAHGDVLLPPWWAVVRALDGDKFDDWRGHSPRATVRADTNRAEVLGVVARWRPTRPGVDVGATSDRGMDAFHLG